MYIKRIKIQNIRSISDFEMTFPKPEGWHVLIGENGSGKSSIVRAVAAALVGEPEIHAARISWHSWLKKGENKGSVALELEFDKQYDALDQIQNSNPNLELKRIREKIQVDTIKSATTLEEPELEYPQKDYEGLFSAGYGPLRRFTGGDEKKQDLSEDYPKVDAHISLFGEDVALTEALVWLWELHNKHNEEMQGEYMKIVETIFKNLTEAQVQKLVFFSALEQKENRDDLENRILKTIKEGMQIDPIDNFEVKVQQYLNSANIADKKEKENAFRLFKTFLNISNFLPHNTQLQGFDEDKNIIFSDNEGNKIPVVEMSDGYRSILSLMFDLIRQLVRVYGEEAVFKNIKAGEMNIPLPGVVLIDEVDAHLHPNWQISIGQWFTKCFPKIQFIVTTHSPFVCRACEEDKGTIWQLAAPIDGEEQHREIVGDEKEQLIYGNILDAYGTRLFGERSVIRSKKSDEKLERLGRLNARYALGKITKAEEEERSQLLKIFQTDDPTGF